MGNAESAPSACAEYSLQTLIPLQSPDVQLWAASHKRTHDKVSIFIYDIPAGREDARILLVNAIQRVKTLRHPGIIRFIASSLDGESLVLVTEPVYPIIGVLAALPPEEIAIGVHSLLRTVMFLHEQSLSHNSLCLESVFIGESRTGRRFLIAGLELTTAFSANDENPTSLDIMSLSTLLSIIIGAPVNAPETTQSLKICPWRQLQDLVDFLSAKDISRRPRLTALIDTIESTPFIRCVLFIRNIRSLRARDKEKGFERLVKDVSNLDVSTVRGYILPLLLDREFIVEHGAEAFVRVLFTKGGVVDGDLYDSYVLPFIVSAFKTHDTTTRSVLLSNLEAYLSNLPQNSLETLVPELISGTTDTSTNLALANFIALCNVIPHLPTPAVASRQKTLPLSPLPLTIPLGHTVPTPPSSLATACNIVVRAVAHETWPAAEPVRAFVDLARRTRSPKAVRTLGLLLRMLRPEDLAAVLPKLGGGDVDGGWAHSVLKLLMPLLGGMSGAAVLKEFNAAAARIVELGFDDHEDVTERVRRLHAPLSLATVFGEAGPRAVAAGVDDWDWTSSEEVSGGMNVDDADETVVIPTNEDSDQSFKREELERRRQERFEALLARKESRRTESKTLALPPLPVNTETSSGKVVEMKSMDTLLRASSADGWDLSADDLLPKNFNV